MHCTLTPSRLVRSKVSIFHECTLLLFHTYLVMINTKYQAPGLPAAPYRPVIQARIVVAVRPLSLRATATATKSAWLRTRAGGRWSNRSPERSATLSPHHRGLSSWRTAPTLPRLETPRGAARAMFAVLVAFAGVGGCPWSAARP